MAEELKEIASRYFSDLKKNSSSMPAPETLGFPNGNQFDELIGGWTKFWNEIFRPEAPLDPDLVKALIASESGFKIEAQANSRAGRAKGLIQVTEDARKILGSQKGELRDLLITVSKDELSEPVINLATGIRWLFHKKKLATHRLKREATWKETIAEYKGILPQLGKVEKADEILKQLSEYYDQLKRSRNNPHT